LDAKYLDELSERVTNVNGNNSGGYKLLFGLLIASFIFIGLLTKMLFRSRRKLKDIEADTGFSAAPVTTREDIERFIAENLAKASLKSITERFNTSNAYVYTVLAPEKPGALINRLRMEKVMQFRKQNKTASEISEVTGFSKLYVRKIWNNKQI
jgi:AraC-like DNA-binding protein